MSIYSAKTGVTSILKPYTPTERDKAKNAALNKVRFSMPKQKGLLQAVQLACETDNFQQVNEFIVFLRESVLTDAEFIEVMVNARKVANDLSPKFTNLVETLLSTNWINRSTEAAVSAYIEFFIDIMVAHNNYIHFGLPKLIATWIPNDSEGEQWPNGSPDDGKQKELEKVHNLLDRILTAVPLSFDVVLEATESKFPYFKKPAHVIAGYIHNLLWLIDYKPIFKEFILRLVLQKLLLLDVNAPRDEIEAAEGDEDEDDDDDDGTKMDAEPIFEMEENMSIIVSGVGEPQQQQMKHPIAQTLDISMSKLLLYLQSKNPNGLNLNDEQKFNKQLQANKFLKALQSTFEEIVLPSHNTHHVQFLMFYYCSFKSSYAEEFLAFLWDKIQNPNTSAIIRQAAVGYLSSFISRSKFISISLIKHYLKELCTWAHNYIERCDQYRFNGSLKANLVFYAVCQAIFYVIAFRCRDLTADKKSLVFLQSLHLSALVTCNFNPLRVCLPAVATTFAGVTRTYQLAYCYTILERNARRKLATVYANDTATPEEMLDTFFPFDPYLLKMSGKKIEPLYMKYQASEDDEKTTSSSDPVANHRMRRKRGDSEMVDDLDVDDFLIADKRQKFQDFAKSIEREAQFTYGLSPGFHT